MKSIFSLVLFFGILYFTFKKHLKFKLHIAEIIQVSYSHAFASKNETVELCWCNNHAAYCNSTTTIAHILVYFN